jgi:DnaK suppressor protein
MATSKIKSGNSAKREPVQRKKTSARPAKSSKSVPKKTSSAPAKSKPRRELSAHEAVVRANDHRAKPPQKLSAFLKKQREKLLNLRDGVLDSMYGVAKDSLRSRAEGSEASAFGMHQADAGSDAYDRDFALSLLSQEQDALYEIDEALKRVDGGTYGVCEMSNKAIPRARLEAIPFARFTVECQSQLEKLNRFSRNRQPVASLFGLTEEEEGEEEETAAEKE